MIKKLENRKWKVINSTPLLNCGPWLNIRQELVELPSGAQIPTWFVMHFPIMRQIMISCFFCSVAVINY